MLIKQKFIALLAAAGLVLLAPISVHAESASNDNTIDSIDFQSWNNVTAIGKFDNYHGPTVSRLVPLTPHSRFAPVLKNAG